MNFVGLRYWQWILIGLGVGSLIGCAWMGTPADLPRSGDPSDFTRAVSQYVAVKANNGVQRIRNIVVYPPEIDPSDVQVYPVTYESLAAGPDGKPKYVPWSLYAKTPYVEPWGARTQHPTIVDYLTKHQVPFTDKVGGAKYMPVAYGAVSGFVLIGLLWPTTIQLLVNAGLATAPPPKPKKVKLPKSSKITSENYGDDKGGQRGVTSGDVNSLNALNDDLEKRLADGLKPGDGRSAAAVTADEPVSLFMSGKGSSGAADPTANPVAVAEPEQPKDYKGDYYPVARPAAKNDAKPH